MSNPTVNVSPMLWAGESLWLGIRYCIARYRSESNPQYEVERVMKLERALELLCEGRLVSGWHAGHEFGLCDLCRPLGVVKKLRQGDE
jgi:hypothetical protein